MLNNQDEYQQALYSTIKEAGKYSTFFCFLKEISKDHLVKSESLNPRLTLKNPLHLIVYKLLHICELFYPSHTSPKRSASRHTSNIKGQIISQ